MQYTLLFGENHDFKSAIVTKYIAGVFIDVNDPEERTLIIWMVCGSNFKVRYNTASTCRENFNAVISELKTES